MSEPSPLQRMLGVGTGARVLVRGAPEAFAARLAGPPAEPRVVTSLRRGAAVDLGIGFARSLADVDRHLSDLCPRLSQDGALWIAWPVRASREAADCTTTAIRTRGWAAGLVDAKVAAVEPGWSGIRFIPRAPDRPRTAEAAAAYRAVR